MCVLCRILCYLHVRALCLQYEYEELVMETEYYEEEYEEQVPVERVIEETVYEKVCVRESLFACVYIS